MEDRDLGRDRALRSPVAALRALGRDRERLLVRLGQEFVELLEGPLVELQRRALQHDVGVLERAGVRRRGEIVDQFLDRLAGQLAPQLRRQRAPLALLELGTGRGPVEMLQRAAARLRAYELDAV